jgi:hypothetical protein
MAHLQANRIAMKQGTTLPLPVLKAKAALALDQAQAQIQRERNVLPASDQMRLLPELLRSAISSLALAGSPRPSARAVPVRTGSPQLSQSAVG